MKKHIYIGIAALALSLVSCQKEEATPSIDPNAVRVTATVGDDVLSRSNPNGASPDDRAKFNDGDDISISAEGQDAKIHTLSGDVWSPAENKYLTWATETMTFNAFYPTTTGTSMTEFTLPTDQTTAENIAAADYMTFSGSKTKPADGNAVSLAFARKTARVIVKITGFGDEFETTATISNLYIYSGAKFFGGNDGTPTRITPLVVASAEGTGKKGTTYTALVVPIYGDANTSFLGVTVGEKVLTVKGIPALEAAKSYTYNLTIGKDVVTVGSVEVSDWATGTAISGDTEEFIPIMLTDFGAGKKYETDFPEGDTWVIEDKGAPTYDAFRVLTERLKTITGEPINLEFPNLIELPDAVGGTGALEGATMLKSFDAPKLTKIGTYAFSGCSGLTGDLTIPNSVTTIGANAFYACSGFNGNLILPTNVNFQKIGPSAFQDCSSLTSDLKIPDNVTTIGESAFRGCAGFNGNLILPENDQFKEIVANVFFDCKGLTGDLKIPNSVTTIGDYAFYGCRVLTGNLTLPDNAQFKSIGNYAFNGCRSLTGNLTLPTNDVFTSISMGVFSGCNGLTSVTIPASVATIGEHAFNSCRLLKTVTCLGNTPPALGSIVFSGTTELTSILVPSESVTAYQAATNWSAFKDIISAISQL